MDIFVGFLGLVLAIALIVFSLIALFSSPPAKAVGGRVRAHVPGTSKKGKAGSGGVDACSAIVDGGGGDDGGNHGHGGHGHGHGCGGHHGCSGHGCGGH